MKTLISVLSFTVFVIAIGCTPDTSTGTLSIDSLMADWDHPNHPGGVVGIMKNGNVEYLKAFGLASLEYNIPNTTHTIFNTGSVSKQFTAMGIVLLELDGKLSVDDDIRKYLPELPDYETPITIRHMLHHTSGLRSFHAILGIAGWRDDDLRTNEDIYRLLKQMPSLNFNPGEEYMYCNTGYILMAEIIERVAGESFATWMRKNIFDPLDLKNTYVEDQYNRVVLNNATSYYQRDSMTFDRATEFWNYVGSGNMHSTVPDLLNWLTNFYQPHPGWEKAFQRIQTLDPFNNGLENNYAFGIGIYEIDGIKIIQHGGSVGGFSAYVCTYPEQKLNIAILTNYSSSNSGYIARKVAEKYLDYKSSKEERDSVEMPQFKPVSLSNEALMQYEGAYWNDQTNTSRKIYLRTDTLRYSRSDNSESPIVPINENGFKMLPIEVGVYVEFERDAEQGMLMNVTVGNSPPELFKSFELPPVTDDYLIEYVGRYFSKEIETGYSIRLEKGTLYSYHIRHGLSKLVPVKKDVFEGIYPLSIIKYLRDNKGNISGISVSNERVRNLLFEKRNN